MRWQLCDLVARRSHYVLTFAGKELAKLRVEPGLFSIRSKWGHGEGDTNYRPIPAAELLSAFREAERIVREELSKVLASNPAC